jgi:Carbohydrate esterase, sialic acid-specific acetylesterase
MNRNLARVVAALSGGGGGAASQALLAGEASGFAVDFTEPDLTKQVFVKGQGANDGFHAADSFLTVSTGVKRVFNSAGARANSTANDLAYDYNPSTLALNGIICEPQGKQNLLLNATASGVPTQVVAVTAQAYTLAFYGTGTIVLTGASVAGPLVGTGANDRVSLTFTPSVGSLTLTVSGTCTEAQLETGLNATTPVITGAVPVTRDDDRISLDLTKISTISGEFSIYIDWEVGDIIDTDQTVLTMQTAGGLSDYVRLNQDGALPFLRHREASVSASDITSIGTLVKGQRHQMTFRSKVNFAAGSIDGSCLGLRQNTVDVVVPSVFNVLALGTWYNSSPLKGMTRIRRMVVVPRAVENRSIADWRYVRATSADVVDLFVIAGQSNTRNGLTADPGGLDAPGPNVFQLNHYAVTKVSAVEPLNHLPAPVADANGFGVAFARDHYFPAIGRDVLLLPCGVDNTGFLDDRWDVDRDLYNMVESIIGVAMRKFPNAQLKAILWHQGEREADAGTPWTQGQYETAFDAMVAGYRTTFGSTLPIIVGGMVPGWVADVPARQGVADAHVATPGRIAHAGYANPSVPSNISSVGTTVHYAAADQRLFGGRYWTAFQALT